MSALRTTASQDEAVPVTPLSSDVTRLAQQLRAVAALDAARRVTEDAAACAGRSREMRMDATRRLEVLRRQHAALVQRAHEQLTSSRATPGSGRRVVIAHRSQWFVQRVTARLHERGLEVVAAVDNGADAVGLVAAEQPELLLVEESLAMVPGAQVVREVRTLSPATVVVAQVAHADGVQALLEAGASTVFTRQVPPLEVAEGLAELVPS